MLYVVARSRAKDSVRHSFRVLETFTLIAVDMFRAIDKTNLQSHKRPKESDDKIDKRSKLF